MTIFWAQVKSNEKGLCRCGQCTTSELSYTEEMDQCWNASEPLIPSSPDTDQSYHTPLIEESESKPLPEDVQLPSPMTSEEAQILVPPPRATSPGREVSHQRCWTCCKVDLAPGAGASGRLFWRSTGLCGKGRTRPYPAGRGEVGDSARDWWVQTLKHQGPSEPGPVSPWELHALFHNLSS